MDASTMPLVLIVDPAVAERDSAARMFTEAGWRTMTAAEATEALAALRCSPALIILDPNLRTSTDRHLAPTIRRHKGAIGRVPIVAWGAGPIDPADPQATDFDGMLAKPCSAEQLAAAADAWRPEMPPPALVRLKAAFGETETEALLDRFRLLLIDALEALASDAARDLAHRVAGMAGMLGYATLGKKWLALSEGESIDRMDLRQATRRAVAGIDRML